MRDASRRSEPGLKARERAIRLLILDVDGILTDRRIILDSDGRTVKSFDVRDGFGLVLARQAGLKIAIITAEQSPVVSHRARQLKVDWVAQGARDKGEAFRRCLRHFRTVASKAAFMGDDLLDLPILIRAGFSATVPDAPSEVKKRVHYITKAHGGRGAVREVVERLLRTQGRWDAIVQRFL